MKIKRNKAIYAILIIVALALSACSNMRWGTSAGVSVDFGPNGPRVRPHMDVDLYSGGRL